MFDGLPCLKDGDHPGSKKPGKTNKYWNLISFEYLNLDSEYQYILVVFICSPETQEKAFLCKKKFSQPIQSSHLEVSQVPEEQKGVYKVDQFPYRRWGSYWRHPGHPWRPKHWRLWIVGGKFKFFKSSNAIF